ncbi:MAG: hypothetical protein IJA91_02270, partial [Clostridia bacterium]|nr:hypothetical protein [Clostridia bacterium]
MDKSAKSNQPVKRRGSVIWKGLNRGTSWFYAILLRSFIGRILTGYRTADDLLAKGKRYTGRHRCTPASAAHLRLVKVLEESRLFGGLCTLFHVLSACPTLFYGLFGLSYGLFGVLLHYVFRFALDFITLPSEHLVASVIIAVLSLPLVCTAKPLLNAVGDSATGRLIFVRFLGISRDRMQVVPMKVSHAGYYLSCLWGLLGAVAALFISPWIIPVALFVVGGVGMILTYPETGVVLSVAMLPVTWVDRQYLILPVLLILITWGSYFIKLLRLHRTIRFGLLDRVILIFGLVMAVSAFTGKVITAETVRQSLYLLIFLSLYFLVVNLMTTRAYIRRCLFGVGVSLVVVILLSYLRLVPVDSLSWMEGSRAGDAIIEGFRNG